ncbi:lysophosphatidylcholine acyltransferase 2-like [Tubulanus polymorphus]|uniref:lysophosphatidylcholine acyltransferase 2-like n=1 Tax=Tubulanus polymorphus TaxID=672921 RepID=UPI003DA2377E
MDWIPRVPRKNSLILPEIKNPFTHRLKLSWCDWIKIAIMTVTIFPLRCMLIILIVIAAWPIGFVCLYGVTEDENSKPFVGWRRVLRRCIEILWRSMFFVGGFHWITVKGQRASARQAPILALAPHSSFLDTMLPGTVLQATSPVAKAAAADIFLFGHLIRTTQPVYVSRDNQGSRIDTIEEIKRRAVSGGAWSQVMIFPEGTCTNRSCLITFKPGAFIPGVPVQPVCIRYPNKVDTVTWTWDGPAAAMIFWITLCQLHNKMEVEFLPVHVPTDEEIANPKLFASAVRTKMAQCLKIPVTDHTFDDCKLMVYAAKRKLPMATGLIEFQKLSRRLGLKYDKIKELLEKFSNISNKHGQITIDEFSEHLGLPVSQPLQHLFSLYDRDGSGSIDFREYVIGLSLISMPANTEETIQLAFKLFDVDGDGFISREDLTTILHQAFSMNEFDVEKLFADVHTARNGKISFDEFKAYASQKPEYASLFVTYQGMKKKSVANGPNGGNHIKSKSE